MTVDPQVATCVSGGYELAEGVRWVDGRLIFIDILAGDLFEIGRQSGSARRIAHLDCPLGAVAPIHGRPNEWIVAGGTGIALLTANGTLDWLGQPAKSRRTDARMNDGACDPTGRFWAGSMANDATPGAGCLYRPDTDGSITRVLDGLTVPNGPAFTADGQVMYVADTAIGVIYRCELDLTSGDIGRREIFVEVPPADGAPDGMSVDTDGRVWVALWDGAAVRPSVNSPNHRTTSGSLSPSRQSGLLRVGADQSGHRGAGRVVRGCCQVDASKP